MTPELRVYDDNGTLYIEQRQLLTRYAKRATDHLDYDEESPDWIAARQAAQALLNLGLNDDKPLVLLPPANETLKLAALLVGIPYAEQALDALTPGLIYGPGQELPRAVATPAVDRAYAQVTPDTIAMFVATPDGEVCICTHRMITSAEEIARSGGTPTFGCVEAGPYILIDGLPPRGVQIKLLADGEMRVKAPTVTPGYWRRPDLTRAAFDEEGYFRIRNARFRYDGRVIVKVDSQ